MISFEMPLPDEAYTYLIFDTENLQLQNSQSQGSQTGLTLGEYFAICIQNPHWIEAAPPRMAQWIWRTKIHHNNNTHSNAFYTCDTINVTFLAIITILSHPVQQV